MKATFKPEFLNRLDDVVTFDPLKKDQIRNIVKIQLESLRRRLMERKIDLQVDDAVLDYLADVGYDPDYGARPLKRAIQEHVQNELARRIIGKEVVPGRPVKVHLVKNKIAFSA